MQQFHPNQLYKIDIYTAQINLKLMIFAQILMYIYDASAAIIM